MIGWDSVSGGRGRSSTCCDTSRSPRDNTGVMPPFAYFEHDENKTSQGTPRSNKYIFSRCLSTRRLALARMCECVCDTEHETRLLVRQGYRRVRLTTIYTHAVAIAGDFTVSKRFHVWKLNCPSGRWTLLYGLSTWRARACVHFVGYACASSPVLRVSTVGAPVNSRASVRGIVFYRDVAGNISEGPCRFPRDSFRVCGFLLSSRIVFVTKRATVTEKRKIRHKSSRRPQRRHGSGFTLLCYRCR